MHRSSRAVALTLSLAALALAAAPFRAAAQRERLSMDPGWRFTLGDPAGRRAARVRRPRVAPAWICRTTGASRARRRRTPRPVDAGRICPPASAGTARRSGCRPAGAGTRCGCEFDGVYMNSDVWINGVHLGHRPYGYTSLSYDVTRHLVPGVNVVAVRVDNSLQPNSRWYTGSGIYRHTWLTIADPLHVAHWGTVVTTPHVDSARALVLVRTRVNNDQRGHSPRHPADRWSWTARGAKSRARTRPSRSPPGRRQDVRAAAARRVAARCGRSETPTLYALRTHGARGHAGGGHHGDAVRHPDDRVRQGPRIPAQRQAGEAARRQPAPERRRGGRGRAGAHLGERGWIHSRRWA